ncbi:MAG: glycosyltransferase family 1 protein [Chloroflexia bacterium]
MVPANPNPIGIDAHMVGAHETGNETYVVQLSAALAKLGGHTYNLYTPNPQYIPSDLSTHPSINIRSFPIVPAFVRIPFVYPKLARRDHLSLLHMTYMAPPILSCPLVLSVHDVSYKLFPQYFSPRVRFLLSLLVGPSVRRAACVIAISENTRRDIIRFYRADPDRVIVTPLAASPRFKPQPPEEIARIRRIYNLHTDYILAVGNKQPRKNLRRLIRAFAALALDFPDLTLAIAGQSGWQGSQIEAEVSTLGLTNRVRFTGYIPEADLPALYSGATIFCYPSLYEGFGLPPLEAMSCGTPTITSNTSSLPEVVANAALTINPTSIPDLTNALHTLLQDPAKRHEYAQRGIARAAHFSWERTARLTRDAYDSVLTPTILT